MSVISEMESSRRDAEQLLKLLKPDRPRLEPRLMPGLIDGLVADARLLLEKAVGAGSARQAKKAATKVQGNAAELLVELIMAWRSTMKRNKLDDAILKRAGVGKKVSVGVLKSVVEAAEDLAQAYAMYPDQVRGAGVLPADVERLATLRAQLTTVDLAQEETKVTSKEMTSARNAAHKRVKSAIAAIVGAAELAFIGDPDRIAMYRALLPTKSATRKAPAPQA
ncbi:hypothetical protein KKD52_09275 [Myxococcota bacterium]|nr:hypothetical protein [Myxococcota bacterium]MBU1510538.1 hypothetical protein [Myxococcota bacterium]